MSDTVFEQVNLRAAKDPVIYAAYHQRRDAGWTDEEMYAHMALALSKSNEALRAEMVAMLERGYVRVQG